MNKPEVKYHVDKCLNVVEVLDRMKEKYNLDLYNHKGVKFYTFLEKKLMDNVVFPETQFKDLYGQEDTRYNNFIGYSSVVEVPMHYDSSDDDANFDRNKEEYIKKMTGYFNYKHDKSETEIKEHIDECVKYTNFGTKNFEAVNEILKALHEEYSQYYIDGKIRLWYPRDDWEPWENKEEYDYPEDEKSYKLSELVTYFDDKYGFDATDLHDWLLDYNFIEGRHWETTHEFYHNGQGSGFTKTNFRKKNAPESLEHVLNILEKDFIDEESDAITIFIDYYKEYSDRD